MKKKIGILALCLITAVSMMGLSGCGDDTNPYSGLDLSQYIKVGKYKGLKAEKVSVTVEKSDIADKINEDLESAAEETKLKKGDVVEDGDTVNINYVGKIDGKEFDGGSAKKYDLELGSGSFIDGFESGLEGHTVGEKNIKLNLAFPLDYSSEDLQGKDVEFTVKINSAKRNVKSEYNDAFAKKMGDYKNTEEYEKAVEEKLKAEKKEEANKEQQDELWQQALDNTTVKKYPEDMVQHYMDNYDEQLDYVAEQYGTDRKTVMEQYYGITTEKALKKQFKESAQLLVKQEMLIEYIAEKEGLEYTDEEMEKLRQNIESQGYDEEKVEQQTGRTMDQYLHIELLYEKVLDFIQDNAVIE